MAIMHQMKRLGIVLAITAIFTAGCSGGNDSIAPADPMPIDTQSPSKAEAPSSAPPASESASPSSAPTPSIDEVSRIMSSMTLEEKIGQMIMIGIDGTTMDATAESLIKERHVGGVIFYKDNLENLTAAVKLINELKTANADNDAPLFLAVDEEGGKVSRLPADAFEPLPNHAAVGKTGDAGLAKEMGSLLAAQLNAVGLNLNLAPVLDVNSNPDNPIIGVRSFGSQADLVAKLGVAEMKGIQEGGIITALKHYPGHGDTSVDSHLTLPVVDKTLEQLQALEWIPFKAAIEEGADMVMAAHILYPQLDPNTPASFSKIIIDEQLRGTLGFDGVVITDEMTMGAISNHFGIIPAALRAVEAGTDILMIAHGYNNMKSVYNQLLMAVQEGKIPESRIDESVRRILTLKLKYGLSDEPTPIPGTTDLPNEQVRAWKQKLAKAASGSK